MAVLAAALCGPGASARAEDGLAAALARRAAQQLQERTQALATIDSRLAQVASRLCSSPAAPPPRGAEEEEFAATRMALWDHGVADYDFAWRRLRFRGAADVDGLSQGLAEGLGDRRYTHLGAAVIEDRGAGGCASLVWTRRIAFPREPVPGARTPEGGRLRFTLARGYGGPRVLVATPDGRVLSGRVVVDADVWTAEYPLAGAGSAHRVEVVADGPEGTAVALLFPVGAPRTAPATAGEAPSGEDPVDELAAERLFLTWINAERAAAGLAALEPDPRLEEAARGHSRAMLGQGFFGHDDPDGRTLPDRLSGAGVLYSLATENVGRASTPAIAHACFMASPGHRANVLDARVTHVGIGVARQGDAWAVTEDFARLLPAGDGAALRAGALERVAELRARAGLPPVLERRVLSDLAQELAEEAARDGRAAVPGSQDGRIGERVRFALPATGRVAADLVVTGSLSGLDAAGHVYDAGVKWVGVGLARGPGPADAAGRRVGDGMLWLVVLLAAPG